MEKPYNRLMMMDNKHNNSLPSREGWGGSSFKLRAYTKKELALRYFPDSSPGVAVNHLMAWIKGCSSLIDALRVAGYVKTSKGFTPRQVRMIVEFLGEP